MLRADEARQIGRLSQRAVVAVVPVRGDPEAALQDLLVEVKCLQRPQRGALERDPRCADPPLGLGLEHIDVESRAGERAGQGEPTDPPTHDEGRRPTTWYSIDHIAQSSASGGRTFRPPKRTWDPTAADPRAVDQTLTRAEPPE